MIKEQIFNKLANAVKEAVQAGKFGNVKELQTDNLIIEIPKNTVFGDFAVNISPLSKYARTAPPKIAETVLPYIKLEDVDISITGGFINFKLGKTWLNSSLKEIIEQKDDFGKNNFGQGEKVLLEYVSANPTGPLHIGHGRWAAMGSALGNLLIFSGYNVSQEFYINDAGVQINNLAKSFWIRVLQQLGENVEIPSEGEEAKSYYPGDYLVELAKDYLSNNENKQKAESLKTLSPDPLKPTSDVMTEMATYGKAVLLQQQKDLLENLRVHFDIYFSETTLHNSGEVESCVEELKKRNEIYEHDGAVWFKSSGYGDDQDRVIKKTDGTNTYLTADIAYHYDKIKRGYDRLINIWGADHHGYVPRMKAALQAFGFNPDKLEVLLGQLVNLVISGEQVRMGKRRKMITLGDLVNDVGVDATRFWMIMRSIDTTLDFDVDLAKSNTDENPVFYVQYAHARACSIIRTAISERFDQDKNQTLPPYIAESELSALLDSKNTESLDCTPLWNEEDVKSIEATKALILKLESFNDVVISAAKLRAPYIIARYVQELASDFHRFYTFTRVLNTPEQVMKARLALVFATKQVLANGLKILGVSAPEKM